MVVLEKNGIHGGGENEGKRDQKRKRKSTSSRKGAFNKSLKYAGKCCSFPGGKNGSKKGYNNLQSRKQPGGRILRVSPAKGKFRTSYSMLDVDCSCRRGTGSLYSKETTLSGRSLKEKVECADIHMNEGQHRKARQRKTRRLKEEKICRKARSSLCFERT